MLGFLGQFKSATLQAEPEEKKSGKSKSSNSEEFLKSAKAQKFIGKWSNKKKDGKSVYTKRGITSLLGALFGGSDDDDDALNKADDILSKLGSMDGLEGFLVGWKASTEGLMKGLKEAMGGK
ncbi:hypothetical protein JXA56_01480 [Candidatus Micrarchaeota archaeon]|nr:hypothetical protein [Candidatus Micrarchaeota archaeon]